MKKEPSEDFQIAVKALKRRKHARMPRGYKKDPTKLESIVLVPDRSCESCKSPFKKDREVTIGGFTRTDKACTQGEPCKEWTPYYEEVEI